MKSNVANRDDTALVARLLEEYLEQFESGEFVDLEMLLADHPHVAPRVRDCLQSLQLVQDVTSGLATPTGTSAHDEPPLQHIGEFKIIREIGRGGMGVVYEAQQQSLNRRVALKVLPFAALLDPRRLARFHNEAQAAAMLKHAHIVSVFSVGCERGIHFYAMELIDGQSLAEVIPDLQYEANADGISASGCSAKEDAAYESEQFGDWKNSAAADTDPVARLSTGNSANRQSFFRGVAHLGIDASNALHYAHQNGVIHRDVKPSNLLLDREGKLHVTDFGLARIQSGNELTMTGDVLGTLRYMSPEQLKEQFVGERTDVYSLGVTLYELASGVPAFPAEQRHELVQQLLESNPVSLKKVAPSIPRDLETIILRSMEKDPAARYANCSELRDDLQRFLDHRPVKARRVSRWERTRRWILRNRGVSALLATVMVLLLSIASGSAGFAWRLADEANKLTETVYARDMNLVQRLLEEGSYVEAQNRLSRWLQEDATHDPRGFEWFYFWHRCQQLASDAVLDHGLGVWDACFLDDGKVLATGWWNDGITLWDASTCQKIGKLDTGLHKTWSMALDPSGRTLAAGDEDGRIVLFDLESKMRIDKISTGAPSCQDGVRHIVFSPDGRYLAIVSGNPMNLDSRERMGAIYVWDRQKRVWAHKFDRLWGVPSVTFSSCGKQLWGADFQGTLSMWSTDDWTLTRSIELTQDRVTAICLTRDSASLLVGIATHPSSKMPRAARIDHWDVGTWKRIAQYDMQHSEVSCIATDSGKLAVAGTNDGRAALIDLDQQQVVASRVAHHGNMTSISFSPDDRRIVSTSRDNTARLWNVERFPDVEGSTRVVHFSSSWLQSLSFIDDGNAVAVSDFLGNVRHVDVRTGEAIGQFNSFSDVEKLEICTIATSPDGSLVAVQYGKWPPESIGRVQIHRLRTHELIATAAIDAATIHVAPEFSRSSRELAVAAATNVLIVDAATGKITQELPHPCAKSHAFSSDGRWYACGQGKGLHLYRTGDWKLAWSKRVAKWATEGVTFSPDSSVLASADDERRVNLWQVSNGKLVRRSDPFPDWIINLRFSPDGRRLLGLSKDGHARLLHAETLDELVSFRMSQGWICDAGFSPDGNCDCHRCRQRSAVLPRRACRQINGPYAPATPRGHLRQMDIAY